MVSVTKKKKVTIVITIAFFSGGVVEKKKVMATVTVAFFCGGVAKKKKTTTTFITFFNGFAAEKCNGNYCWLFQWFCYKESDDNNVIAFFYGDGVVKKAMATSCRHLFFLLLWSFWSNSLELTINNEMMGFL
jgi:hypothetical protein